MAVNRSKNPVFGRFKNTKSFKAAAKKVKWLVTDCDGVLTDASVYYSAKGEELKRFSFRDGMGVERVRQVGIKVAFMTREQSQIVARRAEKLKIEDCRLGVQDKALEFKQFLSDHQIKAEQVAYIGDDLNDQEVLALAGVSACPNDAFAGILPTVDFVSNSKGGAGAFRDFCESLIGALRST